MAIIDRYPRLSNFATQARNEGYSDDEIDNYVRAKFLKPAQKEGYGPEEINKFLGVQQPTFFEKLIAGPVGKATRATLEGLAAPVEAAGSMIGGGLYATAQPIAGAIGGGLAMLRGKPIPEGERTVQALLEKARPYIAPEPRTPLAKTAVEVASAPFTAGQYLLEKAGLPEEKAAPLVGAVGAALPFVLPAARRTITDLINRRRTPAPALPAEAPTLTPRQQEIAQTFEQGLTEAQRLRQSERGGALLRQQLAEQEAAGRPTAPQPAQPAQAARPAAEILPKRAEPVVTPTTPAEEIIPRLRAKEPELAAMRGGAPTNIEDRIAQLEKENAALSQKVQPAKAEPELYNWKATYRLSGTEETRTENVRAFDRAGATRQARNKIPDKEWIISNLKKGKRYEPAEAGTEQFTKPPIRGGAPTGPFELPAQQVAQGLRDAVTNLESLNERARLTTGQAENVAQTGTIQPKPLRKVFREETGAKPETYSYKFSESDIRQGQAQIVSVGRHLQTLLHDMETRGDLMDRNIAQLANDRLQRAIAEANRSADLFRKQRFAAGRAVKAYDSPPIPRDIINTFRELGLVIDGLQSAKERLPIYTNILESMKNIDKLGPLQRQQLWRDFVDAFRLNLFSVPSFSLDLIGNASEIGAQTLGGIGRDLIHATKGDVTFPSIQGIIRTIRERRHLPADIESQLGMTIGGERIRGGFGQNWGTFTKRETLPSAAVDYLVGTPLYFKGIADSWAKRFSGSVTLWREAIEEADRHGLRGADRQAFYDNFWRNPPESSLNRAISEGNKAGFNRALSNFEEGVGRSVTARLLVDAFARWPFQFTRWAGEMLGYNPEIYQRWKAGTLTPEDLGGYVTKTATGWGGLYLLDKMLYDHVDFNSMEYIHPDGNRTRLSNRDPIPTGLFFVALLKGDINKAAGTLRYASVPFARLLVGEGGILGSLVNQTKEAIGRGNADPGALKRESIDTLNRAIPGQAVLSAIKTIFDPTIREGIGANLPGVSRTLPAAINPTTGEPLRPRQEVLGLEFPTIAGTPIPGAKRILDPGAKLLSRYGLLVYRGPRTSIAGYPADEVPEDINREWREEFGKVRSDRLGDLIPQIEQIERDSTREELQPGSELYNLIRKEIQNNDAQSAKIATAIVNGKYGREPAPRERKPTAREKRMPNLGQ